MVTDYLLGQGNTTLDYNCIQPVSNSLLVTMVDFEANTVIPPFDMRAGIDNIFNRVHKIRFPQNTFS